MFKRGKGKLITDYRTKQLYKFYKNNYKNPVSYQDFVQIIMRYFDLLMPEIIEKNLEIRFPERLGDFRIKQKPYKMRLTTTGEIDKRYLAINWDKTLKLWKERYPNTSAEELKQIENKPIVYHLNEHSNTNIYSWYWDRITSNVKYQSYYKLDITRKWDRYLANHIRNNATIYYN